MNLEAHHPSLLLTLGIAALIVWRLYRRMRRWVGRQRYRPARQWISVLCFPMLLVLLAVASLGRPANLGAMAAGAFIGVALGVLGLRLTRYEVTPQGLTYTPNAHIGIALTLLFVGRVLWRTLHFHFIGGPAEQPPDGFVGSPFTLALFAMLAAYYVAYAAGLLRWARHAHTSGGLP